jgi:hypothetical protein
MGASPHSMHLRIASITAAGFWVVAALSR